MAEPAMRQRSLESSLLFMKQEHADTLKGLHEEIQRLQKRCSELTFQLAMETTSTSQEDFFREKTTKLEVELKTCERALESKEVELQKKEKKVTFLEEKFKAQERKYRDELKCRDQKIKELTAELDTKANTIAYMQLNTLRKSRDLHTESAAVELDQTRTEATSPRGGRFPTPPKEGSAKHRRRHTRQAILVDSNILQNAVQPRPPSSRRLGSPDVNLDSIPDPTPFLQKRDSTHLQLSRDLSHSHISRPDRAPLPPIAPSGEGEMLSLIPSQASSITFVQKKALHSKRQEKRTSSSSPEVEVLAVDNVVRRDSSLRKAHEYNSSDA